MRIFLKDWIPGQARDDTVCSLVWFVFSRVLVSKRLDSGSQAGMTRYRGAALLWDALADGEAQLVSLSGTQVAAIDQPPVAFVDGWKVGVALKLGSDRCEIKAGSAIEEKTVDLSSANHKAVLRTAKSNQF